MALTDFIVTVEGMYYQLSLPRIDFMAEGCCLESRFGSI